MQKNNSINICLSSDNNYIQHLAVTIASILKNKAEDDSFSFIILDGGITDENKEKIIALKSICDFDIEFVTVDNSLFAKCPIQDWTHLSIVGYYRLVLPDIKPEWDKIIYLDCDIIVRDSLKELFNLDIGDCYIASVTDISSKKHAKRLGLNSYSNTGVLLISSNKWREDNVTDKLFKWIDENNEKIVLHDQDILNAAINDKIKPLDSKWNTLYLTRSLAEDREKLENAKIIHFIDKKKPWLFYSGDKFAGEYLYYLGFTPFKDFLKTYKKKIVPVSLIKRFLKLIFEIRNIDDNTKLITILGLKFKKKRG